MNAFPTSIQNMRVNRGADVSMTQELVDGPNILIEQLGLLRRRRRVIAMTRGLSPRLVEESRKRPASPPDHGVEEIDDLLPHRHVFLQVSLLVFDAFVGNQNFRDMIFGNVGP